MRMVGKSMLIKGSEDASYVNLLLLGPSFILNQKQM